MSNLLPPNATQQERALADTTERISNVPVPIRDIWNPDTCPWSALPWLAWAYSVDEWDQQWSEKQQRQAIKASYDVHRHKGTIGAVKDAMAALGFSAKIVEWFEQQPAGTPYTFKMLLTVAQEGITLSDINKLLAVIEASKNLRSHLDSIDLTITTQAITYMAAATSIGTELTYAAPAGALLLDGTWSLDASETLNGIKNYFGAHH